MVQQFLPQVVVQRLLRTVSQLVTRPSRPITLVEAKGHHFPFRGTLGVLGGPRLWRIQERLVALHPNERFCASRELCMIDSRNGRNWVSDERGCVRKAYRDC